MRFTRLKMHKWRKNVKILVMVVVIVVLIIVVAQARPPVHNKDQLQVLDVDAPVPVAQMDQGAHDALPVPDKPEIVQVDREIQIDQGNGKFPALTVVIFSDTTMVSIHGRV